VFLLSSAWPLTKVAIDSGSTPLWFAEGRAVISGATIAIILGPRGRLRMPVRQDLPALIAIGGSSLAFTSRWRTKRLPGSLLAVLPSWPTQRRSGSCRCR
jgi:drug/metabolite transporter (DMT)-like permease